MRIPEALIPEMMERIALGSTPGEAAQWLKDVHNVAVSEQTVSKRIKKIAESRAPIVKAITAEILRDKIARDLHALDGVIARAFEDEQKARAIAYNVKPAFPDGALEGETIEGEVRKYPPVIAGSEQYARLMTVARGSRNDLLAAVSLRLKLAGVGVGQEMPKDPNEIKNSLLEKLDRIFARVIEQKPAPEPQPLKLVAGERIS